MLRLGLCAAAGFSIDGSADDWDLGAPVHLQSQTQGVIGGLNK